MTLDTAMEDPFLDELEAFLALPDDDIAALLPAGDALSIDAPHSSVGDARAEKSASIITTTTRFPAAPVHSSHSNRKRALENLRAEAVQLTEQLHRMCDTESVAAMEAAVVERCKRHRAERECQRLREAVYAQNRFLRGLRSMFGPWNMATTTLDIARYLHKFTRLPCSQSTRCSECVGMVEDSRLSAAAAMIDKETQAMGSLDGQLPSIASPCIESECNTHSDGLSVASTSVYALETTDLDIALRSVFVAVSRIVATCNHCHYIKVHKQIVDAGVAQASSNLLYRIMGVDHTSVEEQDTVTVESRNVLLFKRSGDHAVVLWDFVDEDELHPISATTDVTRQATGACLLRLERCDGGRERVVFRSLNTRRYRLQRRSRRDILDRYTHAVSSTRQDHELMFRDLLVDAVAKERAATTLPQ